MWEEKLSWLITLLAIDIEQNSLQCFILIYTISVHGMMFLDFSMSLYFEFCLSMLNF